MKDDDLTFKTFSISVPDNINKEVEHCYRNKYIAFLFVTLNTTAKIENTPILYYPFQIKTYGIPINIPASSTGQWIIPNEFIYGYIGMDKIYAMTDNPSLWLQINLVICI